MEKPDADGFVTIKWPSTSVPFGGVFHSRVPEPTSNSQEFLKVLLNESKLSIAQRQKSRWENRLRQEEPPSAQPPHRPQPSPPRALVRPRTSQRRSHSTIRASGIFDSDGYVPLKRGEDREKLKAQLQRSMEHGDSAEQAPPPPPPRDARAAKPKPELPTDLERKHELLTQIRERAEWLAEMEVLGQAAPHRDTVKDQIAERIRALEALGLPSECSSVRSGGSGFSTLRSTEPPPPVQKRESARSNPSVRSNGAGSQGKKDSAKASVRSRTKGEENVSSYGEMPNLQRSPRRRC